MVAKKSSEMTQDELLEQAVECERLAKEMVILGDASAAWAYREQAEGWLQDALARG